MGIFRWISAIVIDILIIIFAALLTALISMTVIAQYGGPVVREFLGDVQAQVAMLAISGIVGVAIGWFAKGFFSATRKLITRFGEK